MAAKKKKKPAAKKSPAAKTAAAKKPAAKKPAAKKSAATKAAAAAKKPAAKKPAATKAAAAAKKPAAKKSAAKKSAAKKPAAKKAAAAKKLSRKGVVVTGTRHDPPVFLLVHLPVGLSPFDRAERFEDPIEGALGQLGAVSGGGTSIGEDGIPESCDIEIEVSDVIRALPIIRRVLVEQGAPEGSVITRLSRTGDFEVLFAVGG